MIIRVIKKKIPNILHFTEDYEGENFATGGIYSPYYEIIIRNWPTNRKKNFEKEGKYLSYAFLCIFTEDRQHP